MAFFFFHTTVAAVILVRNKKDLDTDLSSEFSLVVNIDSVIKQIGACAYVECSFLENFEVRKVFNAAVEAYTR